MEDLPSWLVPGVIVDGKYEIVRLIGRGGMGVVCEARHTTLGERVALKVLLASAIRSPDATARFLREARAAFAVRDEHVARVLDAGTGPSGDPYLVMELLAGTDLRQLLEERGPLPVAEAVEYTVQACAALTAAHAMGIVHRDVKPANLFLARAQDGAPLVKVLDFGIAKAAEPSGPGLTETATGMGTLPYMAPEQVKAARDVDARADVYSTGATLHELLTGRALFDAPSAAELIVQILHVEPTSVRAFRPDVPPALEAVILRATRKAREERFPTVEMLAMAARAALSASPPAWNAPTPSPAAWGPQLPSALASTAQGPAPFAPPMHAYPPAYAYPHLHPYGGPRALGPPNRAGAVPMTIGGGLFTAGGVLSFAAAAAGLVNSSEIGTAIAIGAAACFVGGPLLVAGIMRATKR